MKRNFVYAAFAFALVLPLAGSVAFGQAPAATDPAMQNQLQNQGGATPAHHVPDPHKMALRMGRELNLSADQTAKLEPILAERQQKVQALRADTTLTPEQMHRQMHAIAKNTKQEMAGVLTPEQMQQWKAMRKNHENKQNDAPTGA